MSRGSSEVSTRDHVWAVAMAVILGVVAAALFAAAVWIVVRVVMAVVTWWLQSGS